MKKRLLQIVMAMLLSAMVLSGCEGISFGKDNETVESTKKDKKDKKDIKDKKNKKDKNILTEDDIDIDELKENDGLMLSLMNYNWDLVNPADDYWDYSTYDVYYDGTIIITNAYNISPDKVAGGQLSDDDYVTLYLFGINAVTNDTFVNEYVDACDGEGWDFVFYDTDGNQTMIHSGYSYGITELEDIQSLVEDYAKSLDFTSMTDGATGGYEYEFIPTPGTWEEAYYNKLQEISDQAVEDPYSLDDGSEYPYAYALCDITDDGIPELIIKKGTCEADYNDDIYTYDGAGIQSLGNIWSGHSSFYSNSGNGMYQYNGHMGYGALYYISLVDDEFVYDTILEESGYDDDGNWIEDFEYTDVTAEYPGTKYISYEELDNYLLFDMYNGELPKYSFSKDVADEGSADKFYSAVLENDEFVYAVGDGYMNNVGAINAQSLFEKGVIYNYMSDDAKVVDTLIADVDGNGSYEYVLYLAEGDSDYISYEAILSQEDGMIFCYLTFSSLSTYLTDDGYFLMYDEYPTKPIFYKDKIIWETHF